MSEERARPIRIVVAEDEPLFRDLLVQGLSSFDDLEVVADVDSGEDVLDRMSTDPADVVLLDIHLAGRLTGVAAGVQVRRTWPGAGVVLLSSHADPGILSSLPDDVVGGWSYLLKSSAADLATVARAVRGSAAGLMVVDPALVREPAPAGSAVDALTGRQVEIDAAKRPGLKHGAGREHHAEVADADHDTVRRVSSAFSGLRAPGRWKRSVATGRACHCDAGSRTRTCPG